MVKCTANIFSVRWIIKPFDSNLIQKMLEMLRSFIFTRKTINIHFVTSLKREEEKFPEERFIKLTSILNALPGYRCHLL